jgi:hypothetical protein
MILHQCVRFNISELNERILDEIVNNFAAYDKSEITS